MSNHQIHIIRQVVDRAVGDADVGQPGILHFFAQHTGTHCAGTHTGVTGNDDFTYGRQVARHACNSRFAAFRLGFHILHTACCFVQIVAVFRFGGFQQERRDNEGHRKGCHDSRDVSEVRTFWCHRQNRQDRTRRSRRHQTAVQHSQGEHASHTAQNDCQQQTWVHQNIWEINFVDTTQEVDDCRTAS
ncbi:hypothetical protein SRABI106_01097 [Rahnella aquatilis]|nr:hypothetical protein SRABI106_01097 [Rahnella aquatilis]